MKKISKAFSLVLGLTLVASSVAGLASCKKFQKGDQLTWYTDEYFNINEKSTVTKAIKQKTGLDFTFDSSVGTSTDKLSLMISSDSLPDIISLNAKDSRYKQLAQDGYLYSIEELCEKYGAEIDIGLDIMQNYSVNGKNYGLPSYYYMSDENTTLETNGGMLIRKDWFESYMEYVIDNNLTQVDANGNGIADYDITSVEGAVYACRWVYNNCLSAEEKKSYYGMLLDPFVPSTSYQGVAWMCQYFGVRYEDAEGNYVDGAQTSQFKEVVNFLNTLYNNDTLHPGEPKMLPSAVMTNADNAAVGAVLARGDAFMFCGTPQNLSSYLCSARFPENATDQPVEYCSFIIKNNKREDPQLGDIAGTGHMITSITKKCKDPEAAIKALAYLWSYEGQELCAYGLKGVADENGNITALADEELGKNFTKEEATYYVDGQGVYHYTQSYLDILAQGDADKAAQLGVGEWTLFNRPPYLTSLDWGKKQTNKESAYVNNIKKPLSIYSTSYKPCTGLLDATFDYGGAYDGATYSKLVRIKTKVDARWANMVASCITAANMGAAEARIAECIGDLVELGHTKLYQAYTLKYKARKAELGVTYGYQLNDPNYQKKTISEGGRYTWTKGGKEYTDIWGARGDMNYVYDYDIV